MENPEEILQQLEEFAKLKPKDIPRELEEYLCFVAKTGDPVYQWSVIKCLLREKLINVITEFYESCPSVEIPPCPNVDVFNYDTMKSFILEKLDTFVAAPFTVQRICELLTAPRKEYNRIDKYMRALEKNILVVSTTEPGNHRSQENGDGFVNGIETEHLHDPTNDINIEEMDDTPAWPPKPDEGGEVEATPPVQSTSSSSSSKDDDEIEQQVESFVTENNSSQLLDTLAETVITQQTFVSIEKVDVDGRMEETTIEETDVSVTITAIPAAVQKRRDSIEPPESETEITTTTTTTTIDDDTNKAETKEEVIVEEEEEDEEEEVCTSIIISATDKEDLLLPTEDDEDNIKEPAPVLDDETKLVDVEVESKEIPVEVEAEPTTPETIERDVDEAGQIILIARSDEESETEQVVAVETPVAVVESESQVIDDKKVVDEEEVEVEVEVEAPKEVTPMDVDATLTETTETSNN